MILVTAVTEEVKLILKEVKVQLNKGGVKTEDSAQSTDSLVTPDELFDIFERLLHLFI